MAAEEVVGAAVGIDETDSIVEDDTTEVWDETTDETTVVWVAEETCEVTTEEVWTVVWVEGMMDEVLVVAIWVVGMVVRVAEEAATADVWVGLITDVVLVECEVVTAEVAAAIAVPPEMVAYVLQFDDAPGA